MRSNRCTLLVAVVLLASAFAGCIGGGDDAASSDEDLDSTNSTPESEPDAQTASSNGSRELTVTFEETHEGTLPRGPQTNGTDPSQVFTPLVASYPVPVGEGDRLLNVSYNATYTGSTSVVINVYDPSGEEETDSLEECQSSDLTPQVQAERTCQFEIGSPSSDLAQGEWTVELAWQVGETVESYTLDLTLKGLGPAS